MSVYKCLGYFLTCLCHKVSQQISNDYHSADGDAWLPIARSTVKYIYLLKIFHSCTILEIEERWSDSNAVFIKVANCHVKHNFGNDICKKYRVAVLGFFLYLFFLCIFVSAEERENKQSGQMIEEKFSVPVIAQYLKLDDKSKCI